jgi:hypothetical protein
MSQMKTLQEVDDVQHTERAKILRSIPHPETLPRVTILTLGLPPN